MEPNIGARWEESWREASASAMDGVARSGTLDELEGFRVGLLGRSGSLTLLLKGLKDLPLEDRRRLGGPANELRQRIDSAIAERRTGLEREALERTLSKETLDTTLPGPAPTRGQMHPLTQTMERMAGIFERLGFSWAEGPLVEDEAHNFEALNIPADHPARDMQDTFYVKTGKGSPGSLLLRTHTSPVQVRSLQACRPPAPVRIIVPGRVFRHEAVDASHSAVFHQIEGLYVDKDVTMADLKATLTLFLQDLFGSRARTRLRPSYFPFTEPSAEMDIECILCGGSGCSACKRSGWMEILGAGLVHSNVFKAVGYDPDRWSGFAFGLGVERIAMLHLGITDIRMFYENDLRFLGQFR